MKIKSYPLNQSPFFKLRSKTRMIKLLQLTCDDLKSLMNQNNYEEFVIQSKHLIDHPLFQQKPRNIQNPTPRLKELQKRILCLMSRIEVPDYLYSATKGRSYIDNANHHKNNPVSFCVDIKNFYRSTSIYQVCSFFLNQMHCSPDVAFILSSLVCFKDDNMGLSYLPTGGPVSPVLSFWVNMAMFEELNAYSTKHNLSMTVYIDDLTFSGARILKFMQNRIKSIISSHNYVPHKFKYFGPKDFKVITGGVVKDGSTNAPNKLKAKIRIASREYSNNLQNRGRLANTLKGLAAATGQLDKGARSSILNMLSNTHI